MDVLGHTVDLDHTPSCGNGHRVIIAADAHHAFMADPALKLENRAERDQRQELQRRLLLGKCLVDNTAGAGVNTRIGGISTPILELKVEIIEIPERAAHKEVFADIAERSLDLAFGLRPISSAGLWFEAIMAGQLDA